MNLYYIINEDNEFLYSGQEFEGSTLHTSSILPITTSVVKVAPYDNNYVQWDASVFPRVSSNSGMTNLDLLDLSGIEFVVDIVRGPHSSNTGDYSNSIPCNKIIMPRNCTEHLVMSSSGFVGLFNARTRTVSSVEYGDNIMPDLPNLQRLKLKAEDTGSSTSITNLQFKSLDSLTSADFSGNTSLRSLTLPDMPNLTTLSMSGCTALRDFHIGHCHEVTTMWFRNCTSLKDIDLTNIDILQVNYSSYGMFEGCTNLENVKLNKLFGTTQSMFRNCTSLTTISVELDYSVTNVQSMFYGCTNLEEVYISLGPNVSNTSYMFNNCTSLTTIHCSNDLTGISATNSASMFNGCVSLVGGNGTQYNSSYTNSTYAKIDGEGGTNGYFTYEIADNYYTLNAISASNLCGYIEVPWPNYRVAENAEITLKFHGTNGWIIDYWIRWNNTLKGWEVVGSQDELNITMTGDMLIYAIPKYVGSGLANFTVSLSSYPLLAGIVLGAGTYTQGTNVDIKAIPNTGYVFNRWEEEIDGQYIPLSTNSSYTIRMIGRNMVLRAVFEESTDPYNPQDPSGTGGGGGNYDRDSDTVDYGHNTALDENIWNASATIYTPSREQFINFFDRLYGATTKQRIQNIFQSIGSLGGKITDYIINCYVLPMQVAQSPTEYVFNTGFYEALTNWSSPIALNRYAFIDMGEVDIDEYWGNALDYESDIQLYLPYIGYNNLDARTVMGKTLSIRYYVDLMTGACIAQVKVNGTVMYQFNGNMAYTLPTSQDNRLNEAISGVGDTIKLAGAVASLV